MYQYNNRKLKFGNSNGSTTAGRRIGRVEFTVQSVASRLLWHIRHFFLSADAGLVINPSTEKKTHLTAYKLNSKMTWVLIWRSYYNCFYDSVCASIYVINKCHVSCDWYWLRTKVHFIFNHNGIAIFTSFVSLFPNAHENLGKVENGPLSIVSNQSITAHSSIFFHYRWCFSRNFYICTHRPPHSYACKEMLESFYDMLELCESAHVMDHLVC